MWELVRDLGLHHVQRPPRVSAEAVRIEAATAGDGDGTDTDGTANAPAAPIGHAACYPSTSGSATISTSSMVSA